MRPRMLGFVVAVALVTPLLGGGCKGDPVKCESACRNYAKLIYWEKADAEIAAAPPAQRDELRTQKLAKFSADIEGGEGANLCTNRCISAGNDTQIDCLNAAKTAAQARDCVK